MDKPLVVFDGDCGFCRKWISIWQTNIGDLADFEPFQTAHERYRHIPIEKFEQSVQFITPSGEVYSGAQAVFRMYALLPSKAWMLKCYQIIPLCAPICEAAYSIIAEHRTSASKLMRLVDLPSKKYALTRWLFLRLLGIIYFIAFVSFLVQARGLVGSDGISPAHDYLDAMKLGLGAQSYWLCPTLAWLNSSDQFIDFIPLAGAVLSVPMIIGFFNGPLLLCLWFLYLSIVSIGADFMSFQWDALLLETGFLALFFAPWKRFSCPLKFNENQPSMLVLWLLRWLLFRLMFSSGVVKLTSGDATWRHLTALDYHYWTQPIPNAVAWYIAQAPEIAHKLSCLGMFIIELVVPFMIFGPRPYRLLTAFLLVLLQAAIAFTGNYAFFNWLTVTLCVLLLDDQALGRYIPAVRPPEKAEEPKPKRRNPLAIALAGLLVLLTTCQMVERSFGVPTYITAFDITAPFRIANAYGLFAVMTVSRPEIIVEGSNDGHTWLPYEFKFKAGDLKRPPPFVAPYQPRLDWQMWFAALSNYQNEPWFARFMLRLLNGSKPVLALMDKNPFPDAPPRYIRATTYSYEFTTILEKSKTGDWWKRDLLEPYFPIAGLKKR